MTEDEIKKALEKYSLILNKKSLAYLDTKMANNSSQLTPVWFDLENSYIRINTTVDQHQENPLKISSHVGLYIQDLENPFNNVTIRGVVVDLTEEGAEDHADSLSKKYLDIRQSAYESPWEIRVICRIRPVAISGCID